MELNTISRDHLSEGKTMRRIGIIATLLVTIALVLSTTSNASARPIRSLDELSSRIQGGSLHSPRYKITVSIIGHYKIVRRIHGHRKVFYGVRVSGQHCSVGRHAHCWGKVKHANLPAKGLPGKAVGRTPASRGLGGAACWVSPIVCLNPGEWAKKAAHGVASASHAVGAADEWFFLNITFPCLTGVSTGFVKTAGEQISRRMVFLWGWMSKAKFASGVAGPEGYAVTGLAFCGTAIGAVGVIKATEFAKRLRN